MILKLLKLKIKELRGCTRALNLIDEYVGKTLNDNKNEFHKVIQFFQKCVQFLIRKGHTHRVGFNLIKLPNKTFQQYKESYMQTISYYCSNLVPISNFMDNIDHANILYGNLNDRTGSMLSYTYLYYTIMFNKNTFGKKINNEPICRVPGLDFGYDYYDSYEVKCKICKSFKCSA